MTHKSGDLSDSAVAENSVTCSRSEDGATTTIRVLGHLAGGTESGLNTTIKKAARADAQVILDLSRCDYCDSETLGLVVGWQRRLDERFRLVLAATGNVRRVFEITGLSRRLAITTQP
ncbi:MAG: STAS domain-containing protein [Candidatus Eremiobacteraeota bacterium]|nr:STAS domain-containing protein [Candidatus Eremiobacteraeota bacterium]